MKYGSVCSGIEAASVAWEPLGWEPVWFSEIEPFPSSVLAHHYPNVPNLGDMTKLEDNEYVCSTQLDVVVGGTPCQGFSVAGLRKGLDDDRSNLCLTFVRLVHKISPRWVVWENVPGVFTTGKGQDFGSFLSGLAGVDISVPDKGWKNSGVVVGAEGSYSLAWRVLDAQYTGVPQRRRRVFVVGYLGDWRCAAAVLFESESLQGYPPPSRETRKNPTISTSYGIDEECNATRDGFGPLLRGGQGGTRQAVATFSIAGHGEYGEREGTLGASGGDLGGESEFLVVPFTEVAPTLNAHFGSKQGLEDQHINRVVSLCLTSHYAKGGDPEVDQLIVEKYETATSVLNNAHE